MPWSGYGSPLTMPISGVSLDPTTDIACAFAGIPTYALSGNAAVKLKTFSIDLTSFGSTQLLSAYNKN